MFYASTSVLRILVSNLTFIGDGIQVISAKYWSKVLRQCTTLAPNLPSYFSFNDHKLYIQD